MNAFVEELNEPVAVGEINVFFDNLRVAVRIHGAGSAMRRIRASLKLVGFGLRGVGVDGLAQSPNLAPPLFGGLPFPSEASLIAPIYLHKAFA